MTSNYGPSYAASSTTLTPSIAPSYSTPDSTSIPAPSTTTFPFPSYYNFPPFFTAQKNLTTHHAQLTKWSSLILSFCRFYKIFKLSLSEALESELFYNKTIKKRLSREDAREVVEFMKREGRAEWISEAGKGKGVGEGSVFWVWWRDVEEWAGLIAEWVDETAQKNTVLTLYELTESEATMSQDFHHMDPDLLQKALGILVKRGKAQVFGQEDQQGVKFF
ncbi:related to VPS25 Vacuolar protein sorting (putative) [Rhynchosporium agropyri]|uniref:Vacuolar protein-sorting-associated protein 25 n=2 Tax=Rhynchosporium TaxID=38037 RepID=A0A1E1L334_9HELO|nr:related to VPS25 Vacuolar protein sorting (putative) [Rhynchosporium commune]CZT04926.1 related to VPS25 Vacuolar protein sorting (putative) [Rhynchosporium agropyri]